MGTIGTKVTFGLSSERKGTFQWFELFRIRVAFVAVARKQKLFVFYFIEFGKEEEKCESSFSADNNNK